MGLINDRTYISEVIDASRRNHSNECIVCHYWFFNHGFKYQYSVCNVHHDLLMQCVNISDIAISTVKGADYRCIIHGVSKSDAINLLENLCLMIVDIYKMHTKNICIKNQVFHYHDDLIKSKKVETKNIVIDEKSYKDLVLYTARYDRNKTLTMLNLYYNELMGKIKEHKGKKYLMVDDYVLHKVLDRIKEIIDIEEFDNTEILIDTDDVLPDNIT